MSSFTSQQGQAKPTAPDEDNGWRCRAPYRTRGEDETFEVRWRGGCHCGRVQYQLSRGKPLASKYCHCVTCQKLHAVSYSALLYFDP